MGLISEVAKNIKAYRLKGGLTQQELADRARLDVRYISRLENHPQNVKLDKLETLARALDISVGELVSSGRRTEAGSDVANALDHAIKLLKIAKSKLYVTK